VPLGLCGWRARAEPVLAYSGPRPEGVVCRLAWDDTGEQAIRYVDTKRRKLRFTLLLKPLADDLKEWSLASGRQPVFPAHDGGFWDRDDWRNWRRRTWQGELRRLRSDRSSPNPRQPGVRTQGHPSPRPPLELRHAARLRGCPAHADRPGGGHERPDDRAALRRRDHQLGRKIA
jgi:hypothetical protein